MEKLLTQLLQHDDNRLRIFDMGRRISKLPIDTFTRVEQNRIPYPLPFLHHAWVGLLLWNPSAKDQNLIWFLKLPLDEQGYLIQAARDDIVNRLLQNAIDPQSEQDALKDNPFAFTPDQEKMASFHALASCTLKTPASRYYEDVQQYLAGQLDRDYWSNLGLQGLADYVMRLDQGDNTNQLCKCISQLPEPLLLMLARLLEHTQPNPALQQRLADHLLQLLQHADTPPELIAALIRSLCGGSDKIRDQAIDAVLASPYALEAEVIVALATRCHTSLNQPQRLQRFLEQLAAGKAGQLGFNRILSDLMFLADLRPRILEAFRDPNRSEQLSQAIGEMLGSGFSTTGHAH
ncbi:DUF3549 family protein [Nitrincola iocasae]|jgi:hypothetical protein|uniref:DUF3549 family protein n=1 Tax=Nitrincola iocasae TaxID=2614693 RepID=A0A5J6LC93_9GAMM|nr:DUF3549 family protein [Nitrincola iocasae]QEW05822.1 DUF3549 family protein [Nitrincola iocasae]